jgi:hypothetical protein
MGSRASTDFAFSIQDLEASDWGEPEADATEMVRRCYTLRRKPLQDLAPNEVGLAVRQKIGIPYILDFAVGIVRDEPLLEGDHYPGDILSALLQVADEDWSLRPGLKQDLQPILQRAIAEFAMRPDYDWEAFRSSLDLPDMGSSVH